MYDQRRKLLVFLAGACFAAVGCAGGSTKSLTNFLPATEASANPAAVGVLPTPLSTTSAPVSMTPRPLLSAVVQSSPSSLPAATQSPAPAWGVVGPLPVEAAQSSEAFVDSIGVNIHLLYPDTAYVTQYEAFRQYLINSGIRHIRDGLTDTTWQPYYDHLNDLATQGIHATLVVSMGETAQLIQQIPSRIPNVLEAIEGPNEPDLTSGPNWVSTLRAYVPLLYAAVKSGPLTSRLPVYGPALTTAQAYRDVGDLSQYMDYSNMHNYFGTVNPGGPLPGIPGSSSSAMNILSHIQYASLMGGNKPVVATENGYCTAPNTLNSVPVSVQAKYVPRMFLEQWLAGVQRTLEYEFLDNGSGCDGSFGLIATANGILAPRPAYYALSGMIATLKDSGGTFTPRSLAYQVMTSGTNVVHKLFQKQDGTFEIVIWQEVASVDASGSLPLVVTPIAATFTLAASPARSTLTTFGASGQSTTQPLAWNYGSSQIMVTDSISIVTVKPW